MSNRIAAGATAIVAAATASLALGQTGPQENSATSPVQKAAPEATPSPEPAIDRDILHVQVILEHLGFAPGVLDGRMGQSLEAALRGFQESRGLPITGEVDTATLEALHPFRALRPIRNLALTVQALRGPFVNPIPDDLNEQAKLDYLGYRTPMEKLAEMFHTTPEVLLALNSRDTPLRPGVVVAFPNALPTSRDYPQDLDPEWRQTLNMLNVDAVQPQGDRIVVDKSEGVLKVYDGEKLVGQFSATMGSTHDPLPIGSWTIKGAAYNPPFHYNPDLFWDAEAGDDKATIPPGPNGPVGVIWLDLSKEHYGIHGTPEPTRIGRTQSHGCIRLTNWDAARLSLMIEPGTPAIFQP